MQLEGLGQLKIPMKNSFYDLKGMHPVVLFKYFISQLTAKTQLQIHTHYV
jgi:hypothetical protein